MKARDDTRRPRRARAAPADHAGSVLCRLLMDHPDVIGIELLGQAELIEGTICYSLGVFLPGGRELYIDVEDAPAHHGRARRQPRAVAR